MGEQVEFDFHEKRREGDKGEWLMNTYHTLWFDIVESGNDGRERGYDSIFTRFSDSTPFLVETKVCNRAHETGNLIVETMSKVEFDKLGWAITSEAEILLWYIWFWDEVIYFRMPDIKKRVNQWKERYGELALMKNKQGWTTRAIMVPLTVMRPLAIDFQKHLKYEWMEKHHQRWVGLEPQDHQRFDYW